MIHVLHDTPEGYPFLCRLNRGDVRRHIPSASCRGIASWTVACFGVLRRSRRHDTIVCVLDIQAVICFLLARLTMRRRSIVAVNILLKPDKRSLRNLLARQAYRAAVSSPRFVATVTSTAYGHAVNNALATSARFSLLPDVYHTAYEAAAADTGLHRGDGSVMCGGRNARDWPLMIDIARAMPHVSFTFVMTAGAADRLADRIPSNVTLLADISLDEFNRRLSACSVVAMPLDTAAPAGLIVIFQAAAMLRPVVVTDTPVTRSYVDTSRGYPVAEPTVDAWTGAISQALSDTAGSARRTEALRCFLRAECGEESYLRRLDSIVGSLSHPSIARPR